MAFASLGSVGSANDKSAGTSVAVNSGLATPAGSLVIAIVAKDNAATANGNTSEITSVTDAVGNTWTKAREFTDADLAVLPAPDDTLDRYEVSLPTTVWTAATGAAISKILVCYDSDTAAGTDANIIPLTMFDFAQTPSGADIQMTGGVFFRAS